MKSDARYFDLTFQGIEYEVEVLTQDGDTTVFVQYINSDEEVEENILFKLTNYLISEGVVSYKD